MDGRRPVSEAPNSRLHDSDASDCVRSPSSSTISPTTVLHRHFFPLLALPLAKKETPPRKKRTCSYPRLQSEWKFPETPTEKKSMTVFEDLWSKGFCVVSGSNYGADYVVYDGEEGCSVSMREKHLHVEGEKVLCRVLDHGSPGMRAASPTALAFSRVCCIGGKAHSIPSFVAHVCSCIAFFCALSSWFSRFVCSPCLLPQSPNSRHTPRVLQADSRHAKPDLCVSCTRSISRIFSLRSSSPAPP